MVSVIPKELVCFHALNLNEQLTKKGNNIY
uniref:Uncharacterized protein n=1 Tax=Anguilla anguilla TaxID=7936 RepID=A0A0E9RD30_ANGAN